MFRSRFVLAALLILSIAPLVGCAGRKCCGSTTSSSRPVLYSAPPAPPCNSCPPG